MSVRMCKRLPRWLGEWPILLPVQIFVRALLTATKSGATAFNAWMYFYPLAMSIFFWRMFRRDGHEETRARFRSEQLARKHKAANGGLTP